MPLTADEQWVLGELLGHLDGAATRSDCGERLMGWPDHHTAPAGADTHRYRLCGNGVVAPIAAWIFQGIKEAA